MAIYLINHAELVIMWLALWAVGRAPALINYNLEGAALEHCLNIYGASLVLVDEDPACQQRIEGSRSHMKKKTGMKIRFLDSTLKRAIAQHLTTPIPDTYSAGTKDSFPLCLLYTSGTTACPKRPPSPSSAYAKQDPTSSRPSAPNPGPRATGGTYACPCTTARGVLHTVLCMISGVSLAVGERFSVSTFWRDIHNSESTFFIYVGETARYLLNAKPDPLGKNHNVRCMYGNGLRPDVWERF
jgi:acyl-CoA synthetase (AMP-forming)/AMP-acid ligase II